LPTVADNPTRCRSRCASEFEVTGLILLATLLVLAILEHWFLVLPVPVDKLWSWGLKSHKTGHPVASSKTPVEPGGGHFFGAAPSVFRQVLI
jgi:hypothetical protein